MVWQKRIFCLVALTLLTSQSSLAQEGCSIEVSTVQREIEYGSPMVVTLRLVYQQPRIWHVTGKPRRVDSLDWLNLRVHQSESEQTSLFRLGKTTFDLQGTQGVKYAGRVVLWCHMYEERNKLITRMIFPRAGRYRFKIERGDIESNELEVVVKPSELGERGMAVLADPKDLAFLIGGVYRSTKGELILKRVVDQCRGTVLAKWCAARLGVTYFGEFQQTYPGMGKFSTLYKKGEIKAAVFDEACKYLDLARDLADEFPIREEVIHKLAETESIKGNYQRALSLLKEVAAKYPTGEYGRKASRQKQELEKLVQQDSEETHRRQTSDTGERQDWRVWLSVSVGGVAIVALIAALLLIRKKASTGGE